MIDFWIKNKYWFKSLDHYITVGDKRKIDNRAFIINLNIQINANSNNNNINDAQVCLLMMRDSFYRRQFCFSSLFFNTTLYVFLNALATLSGFASSTTLALFFNRIPSVFFNTQNNVTRKYVIFRAREREIIILITIILQLNFSFDHYFQLILSI